VNWQQHKTLATALRDQGLADCLAARANLRADGAVLQVCGRRITQAHVVVAKCQQSIEKIVKGYLLWHSGAFDPTKGHTPFTRALGNEKHPEIERLCYSLNRINARVVNDIKWLEDLAPRRPTLADDEKGSPVPLNRLSENSEYAFWSPATGVVIAAEGLTMRYHAIRAVKALRAFLTAMARSTPEAFTKDIGFFLEEHPFSTALGGS